MKTILLSVLIVSSFSCTKTYNMDGCVQGKVVSIGGCNQYGLCGILVEIDGWNNRKAYYLMPVIGETVTACKFALSYD